MDGSPDIAERAAVRPLIDVGIASLATAVPQYKFTQEQALERACHFIPRFAQLAPVFARTGVGERYSCVPIEWYKQTRGWRESNEVFIEQALDLLEDVARRAITGAGLETDDIDAIVCVSTTGIAVPSLDARLCNRMGVHPRVERTPIFGLGCAGGTSGLARASQIARAIPGGNVLLLVVELVGVNIHIDEENPSLFISAALFGDGAAALVIQSMDEQGRYRAGSRLIGRVRATGEHMWRDSEYIMGWQVDDGGFNVILSTVLPQFTRDELAPVVDRFLESYGLSRRDINGMVNHPGGPKVLDAVTEALDLAPDALRHSRAVLAEFGNMSAPTVLFVLERAIDSGAAGRHLLTSFGPGFTATFAVVDL